MNDESEDEKNMKMKVFQKWMPLLLLVILGTSPKIFWRKIREGRFAVYVLHVLLHEDEPLIVIVRKS